jgi:hypothetical protein
MSSALTFWESLNDSPTAVAYRSTLVKRVTPYRPAQMPQSAGSELAEKVAALLHAEPHLTRPLAEDQVFRSTPGLWERVREETTVSVHGGTLKQIYARVRQGVETGQVGFGVDQQGRPVTKANVDAEIARKAAYVIAKSTGAVSFDQAAAAVLNADADLHRRWREANYA